MKTRILFKLTFLLLVVFTVSGQDVRLLRDFDGNGLVGLNGKPNSTEKPFFFKSLGRLYTTSGEGADTRYIHINTELEIDFLKENNTSIQPPNEIKSFLAQPVFNRFFFTGITGASSERLLYADQGSKIATELGISGNATILASDIEELALEGNTIFFSAISDGLGREPHFLSSPTPGTNQITTVERFDDINTNSGDSDPRNFVKPSSSASNSTIVYSAFDGTGRFLYKSTVSAPHTSNSTEILYQGINRVENPSAFVTSPYGYFYFSGTDASNNDALYEYNPGSESLTYKWDILDIEAPKEITYIDFGLNYFIIMSSIYGNKGREVAVMFPNTKTVLNYNFNATGDANPRNFIAVNNKAYFIYTEVSGNEQIGYFDGSTTGKITATNSSSITELKVFNNNLYYISNDILYKVDSNDNVTPISFNVDSGIDKVYNFLDEVSGKLLLLVNMTGKNEKELGVYSDDFTTTYSGTSAGDFTNASGWSNGIPNFLSDVIIDGPVYMQSESTIKSLNVNSSFLTISDNGFLTVTGDIDISSSTVASPFNISTALGGNASLIYHGNFTSGTNKMTFFKTYSNDWHLISNPAFFENIENIIPDLATGTGNNVGLATYNNTYSNTGSGGSGNKSSSTSGWEYFTNTSTGGFNLSQGYSLKRATTGITTFKGYPFSDDETIPITQGGDNSWNLIGNPFASSLAVNNLANSTKNLLSINASELDPNYQALYFWDATKNSGNGGYEIINNASDASYVTLGQGFFVYAKTGGGTFAFDDDMQVHAPSNTTFYKNSEKSETSIIPEITVSLTNGTIKKTTQIKYFDNTTRGLDSGYDAGNINIGDSSLKLFSHLIDGNQGVEMGLQCLPKDYENLIIPLGVDAVANSTLEFSSVGSGLPEGINIYIEDKVLNTVKRVDTDTYTITINNNISGTGRFYLHTSAKTVLNINDETIVSTEDVFVNKRTLHITGLSQSTNYNLEIYNLMGQEVLEKEFSKRITEHVELPSTITLGLYVVTLRSAKGTISKKVLIQ